MPIPSFLLSVATVRNILFYKKAPAAYVSFIQQARLPDCRKKGLLQLKHFHQNFLCCSQTWCKKCIPFRRVQPPRLNL